jgi:hypothetical protein
MHITTLVAAALALAGALVVLRWMPGKARPATAPADTAPADAALLANTAPAGAEQETELAIMEQELLQPVEREG